MKPQSWFFAIPILFWCWLAWLYVSAPEQDAYSGSYVFPTAMLSVRIGDPMHADQLRHEIDEFARSHRLRIDPYPAADHRKHAPERIDYSPRIPNLQVGQTECPEYKLGHTRVPSSNECGAFLTHGPTHLHCIVACSGHRRDDGRLSFPRSRCRRAS